MTGKKALEILKKHYIQLANQSKFHYTQLEEEYFNTIEKDLEVLDIFLTKDINIELLKPCINMPDGLLKYNKIWAVSDSCLVAYPEKYLDCDEYNKLKERLENEINFNVDTGTMGSKDS